MATPPDPLSPPEADEHVWGVYEPFWRFMQRQKRIIVMYAGPTPDGERGTFCPNDDAPVPCPPMITVTREHYLTPETEPRRERADKVKPDLLDELITLAHEYGHFVSWGEGHRTPELVEAGNRLFRRRAGDLQEPCLDASQRDLVLQEEERAWSHGRRALQKTGFEWWPAFDQREQEDLGHYKEMLRCDANSEWEPYVEREQDGDDLSDEEAEQLAAEEERAQGAR
ncbi:MAG TPA: hypothetical protein VFS43_40810 [Polyangiaceae bacterium]|nr:hypothetical protein [Polyangiaceae bacterium]